MNEILDNPIWNALISGNNQFAAGNDSAKYFPEEVSPFAAVKDYSKEALQVLCDIVPPQRPYVLFCPEEIIMPDCWKVMMQIKALQMVCDKPAPPEAVDNDIIDLQDKDVPEMLALTRLTSPGPFSSRTIEFGNYQGIFKDGRLVAMAGQRLHPFGYHEVSAVCTHPDYNGRGYAGKLILNQLKLMKVASETPILHVKADNAKAIRLYKKLGFTERKEICIYRMQKQGH